MKSQIALVPQGPIEYTLAGNGPTVLVCHGTSSDCFSAGATESLVAAGFRVVIPSRPGYGRTPLDVGRSAEQAAQALIALLDCLNVRTCALVAISGGGPTGVALAACFPQWITRLVLAEAVTWPEHRPSEPGYKDQTAFYGPTHNAMWGMLGLLSRLSPRSMARQTLAIFSTHDPADGIKQLSQADIHKISRFYQGRSARIGALNDATHTVGADVLTAVRQPTLVIHSREDKSVPFAHAEWSLKHIPHAQLCEAGLTGHFSWVGPDAARIDARMAEFLQAPSP